jgi:hypothetical protein
MDMSLPSSGPKKKSKSETNMEVAIMLCTSYELVSVNVSFSSGPDGMDIGTATYGELYTHKPDR